ncbi:hypothetical protein AB0I72_03110 [Nocardiopsis sp. NPDC049922]|uniref:hypothetical protein n=1 Tax=Nocardiopsis sp. NPDC049922 TaxID=3155157 RepID=UPI0033F25AEE
MGSMRLRALVELILGTRSPDRDRGSATTDWVLMLAVTIGIATGVGAIITPLIIETAQGIDLGVIP